MNQQQRNRTALQLTIKKNKLAKNLKDVFKACKSKPTSLAKVDFSQYRRKEQKKLQKLKLQFFKQGLAALMDWDEFICWVLQSLS